MRTMVTSTVCETVGQIIAELQKISEDTWAHGGLDDSLEVILWKDEETGELSVEIEEIM